MQKVVVKDRTISYSYVCLKKEDGIFTKSEDNSKHLPFNDHSYSTEENSNILFESE